MQQRIAQYKALKKIDDEAWEIITTSFDGSVVSDEDDDVVTDTTTVVKQKFTEGLLRNILDLEPCQQVELCGYLAKGKDKKGHAYNKAKFKQDAVWYRAFNVLWDLADKMLSAAIPDPVLPRILSSACASFSFWPICTQARVSIIAISRLIVCSRSALSTGSAA